MTSATIATQRYVSPRLPVIAGSPALPQSERARFESIYQQYSGRIYAHAYRMTSSAEDAHDLTQECFIRAWHARDHMPRDHELSPWLYRIATNLCLDLQRRRQHIRWTPWEAATHDPLARGDRYDQPEPHAIALETRDEVQRTLALLKPRYRTALLLREFEGRSCAEIAEIFGTSVPAVKSLLFRAREEFRCVYHALDGDDEILAS